MGPKERTFDSFRNIAIAAFVATAALGMTRTSHAGGMGACCLPNGVCVMTDETTCLGFIGTEYRGDGTSCDEPCTELPGGACCFKDGTCMVLIEPACLDAGGKFQGEGTDCDPNRCQRSHTGWNWVDNLITLTKNEPAYWSASSGQPKGVSPFTVLDPPGPGALHGRPAPDGTDERVLRGYIIAYAVNSSGAEVRWNHLKGDVTIVNYDDSSAWEYNAYAFPVVAPVANGQPTGTTGILNLDGAEYVPGYDQLLMDFYASGSIPFRTGDSATRIDTDLTLLPISVDLRQETDGPITTKAHFDVWNMNEVKFSGAYRCITCWDQWLLSQHEIPNHFLRASLQTDKGKARIDGQASQLCDVDKDPKDGIPFGENPADIVSVDASLLGVVMKTLEFGAPANAAGEGDDDSSNIARAGTMLHGMGTQPGVIKVDVLGPPDEATSPNDGPTDLVNELLRSAGLSAVAPRSPRQPANAEGGAAGAGSGNRVSGSEKGSLLIFPKIELRWDENGDLIQDTFVDISNDYPEDIWVQMYFINGDPPLDAKRSDKDDVERELEL